MHGGYLLEYQMKSEDMYTNLIQIFRQMVFHNSFLMHDRMVLVNFLIVD
jgi:hypothetical protein